MPQRKGSRKHSRRAGSLVAGNLVAGKLKRGSRKHSRKHSRKGSRKHSRKGSRKASRGIKKQRGSALVAGKMKRVRKHRGGDLVAGNLVAGAYATQEQTNPYHGSHFWEKVQHFLHVIDPFLIVGPGAGMY